MRTRREFLEALGAAGAGFLAGGCEIEDVEKFVDDRRVDARIGFLAHPELSSATQVGGLRKAFEWFRTIGVDAVVVTGKVTRDGSRTQADILEDVWRRTFGGTKTRLIRQDGPAEVNGFKFVVSSAAPLKRAGDFVFHAGGKHALTDDFRFCDRAYRAIYVGSMSGIVLQDGFVFNGKLCSKTVAPGQQGLLVSVYSDSVVIRRLDFAQKGPVEAQRRFRNPGPYVEDLAEAFVLPRDGDWPKLAEGKPAFWSDTRVRVTKGYAGSNEVLTVSWPNLLKRFVGVRATSYEVGAHFKREGGKISAPFQRFYVLPDGFMCSEDRDLNPVEFVFSRKQLSVGDLKEKIVVSIAPISTSGVVGDPVHSEPFDP